MHKLLPLLALIVTASISAGRPAAAEGRFAGPLPGPFATDVAGPDATIVFVAGMGGGTTSGGMGGGGTSGGMGGGGTTGGMGSGGTTGGMGGSGATGGGIGGGTTGGGMFGTPAPSFGTNGSSDWPGNSAQSSYYTYQCATPARSMLPCRASLASLELASRRCALLLRRRAEPGSDQVEGGTGLGGARRVTDPTREPCPWVGSRNSARFRPGS